MYRTSDSSNYILLIIISSICLTIALGYDLDAVVERQCINNCPKQLPNLTDVTNSDVNCDFDCIVSKCEDGCKLWRSAMNSSCQIVCQKNSSSELITRVFHCVVGCNDAIGKYFELWRSRIGIPPPPVLVADSLTPTSLKLLWNFPPARQSGLTYRVQWQYEELSASWQYCRNQTWGRNNTVFVNNLQPYTKYRFRVAVFLLAHTDPPIVSEPSVVINTLPFGLPASPPAFVQAVAVDSNIISVSWEPGPFPHGPLLSYMLNITENHPNGSSTLKDIPAENRSYMLRNLKPARNYTLSIQMINNIGAGPAKYVTVTTPTEPEVKDTQNPALILGASHSVIEQGSNISDEPLIIYNTTSYITGVAIHVQNKLLFVADSDGYIHKTSLENMLDVPDYEVILSPVQLALKPSLLSIDWLNNRLYILEEVKSGIHVWQICYCNLDGNGLTVAVAGLRNKPHDMQVDPYNGYLFWAIHDGFNKGGLYRLDLADISNGVLHNVTPEAILLEANLGAFTVDHTNFKIYVSNQNRSTVHSISLDQKEIIDARPKIVKSKLEKVVSLATASGQFYWTDGEAVFYEEYHARSNQYFHNSYLVSKASYNKVLVNRLSAQPIPVPVNPPTAVQAIFGTNLAKITWKIPHLLGGQGKGAWQNWSYEISIKDLRTNFIQIYKNINVTSYTITNLTDDTEYLIKTAASTCTGKGPWSSEFRGVSLKKQAYSPTIFWSATEGLLKSDPTGDNVETLIYRSDIKGASFKDLTWFEDKIYIVTNMSQVIWYNLTSHERGHLINIDPVDSIAVDWLGKKLYWSNLKQQVITRGNLNGTHQERLPIFTIAKEMNIDSIHAYIYWSTGLAVECAHLNGSDRFAYYPLDVFSGRQVMGLTLDMEHQMVYWIVRSSEGSKLFRSPMAGTREFSKEPPKTSFSLQKLNVAGPLSYFNKRLIWLQDDKNAVISDLQVENIAIINGKNFLDLNMIYVMDPYLQIKPNISGNHSEIVVIPEMIDEESVKPVGYWNNFNITWNRCVKVNFGKVLYEIKVDSPRKNGTPIITNYNSIKYWDEAQPYSKLYVSLRAFTYWGTSQQIRVEILTPSSVPSAPQNLRSFVTYNNSLYNNDQNQPNVTILLRWEKPLYSNGLLEGYKIDCWMLNDIENANHCDINISADKKEKLLENIRYNKTYLFQVQAYTKVGEGEYSSKLRVHTIKSNPLPVLLTTDADSISLYDVDNEKIDDVLLYGMSKPIDIRYIYSEDKIIWLNEFQELLVYRRSLKNKTKILDAQSNGTVFAIDWLERSLYYVQINEANKESFIYKIDFNHYEKGVNRQQFVLKSNSLIGNVEVCPYDRKLYWTELNPRTNVSTLKKSNIDGTKLESLLEKYTLSSSRNKCNCVKYPNIAKTFALDHSIDKYNPKLIIFDVMNKQILEADKNGCSCNVLVPSGLMKDRFPVKILAADFQSVYFAKSQLYKYSRNSKTLISMPLDVNKFRIYGQHLQPYPQIDCLVPKVHNYSQITLLTKTANSLTIKMPPIVRDANCHNTSMPSVEYVLFYYEIYEDERHNNKKRHLTAHKLQTFDSVVVLSNLKSFTKYAIRLNVTNYFTSESSTIKTRIFQTSVGAPSKPRNVSVSVLNPQLIQVRWMEPEEIDGKFVYYQIHWQTEGTLTGIRHKGEQPLLNYAKNKENFYSYFVNLTPNETYDIWVRAFSQTNHTHTDSKIVKSIRTYPEPDNITLLNNTAYTLYLEWKLPGNVYKYIVQYALLTSNDWKNISDDYVEVEDDFAKIMLSNLKPKTQYKFRLVLNYPNWDGEYVWPKILQFTFETLGDKPTPPGVPKVHRINDLYQVKWEPSIDNGSPIEMYWLEARKFPYYRNKRSTSINRTAWSNLAPSIEEPNFDWEVLYNGTDTSWIINGSMENFKYSFRAYALNDYGWSNASEESEQFELTATPQVAENNFQKITIATIVPVVFLIFLFLFVYCCKCCHKNKKIQKCSIQSRGPDVELAALRELPRRSNFIQNTNVLYVSSHPADDLSHLPHIRRDQIILKKFLGSGAFGEVFEGRAKGLTNSKYSELKVAVKTLRKGASDQEKTEFLQEAQLMSHFKHEHILQLLGVCLDNDPHFIIMELMEGGDLLTYLRLSRKPASNTPPLNLIELLKMCVDVANGCQYLEEMHFVHRDLACRNCLVSCTDPAARIVKIGDFGLARDIYKNDYYRKEGEGLLPVRWMAPESLVDGVFTCQSDVWAFGVLLWEIMTLGQQPYPARNNLEVLHYVRRGGRLGKPMDCPERLHDLMLQCWNFEQERRPSFKYCLETLEILHSQTARNPVTGVHQGQYISTVSQHMDGICNEAYFQDHNHNSNNSDISWKSGSEEDSSKERTPFLGVTEQNGEAKQIPNYLELLADVEPYSSVDSEGYEIPTPSIKHIKRLEESTKLIKNSDKLTATEEQCNSNSEQNKLSEFNKMINDLTQVEVLLRPNITYCNMEQKDVNKLDT